MRPVDPKKAEHEARMASLRDATAKARRVTHRLEWTVARHDSVSKLQAVSGRYSFVAPRGR